MKWTLFFFLSIFLGYAYMWNPFYVSLFPGNNLEILGNIKKFEYPCKDKEPTEKSICTHKYIYPLEKFKSLEKLSIGTGIILYATKYYCEENPSDYILFDDPSNPGKRFDMYSLYQTVPLQRLNCKKNLIIESWSRHGTIRKGCCRWNFGNR